MQLPSCPPPLLHRPTLRLSADVPQVSQLQRHFIAEMLKASTFNKLLSAARECLNMLSRSESLLELGAAAASLGVGQGRVPNGGGVATASLRLVQGQVPTGEGGATASLRLGQGRVPTGGGGATASLRVGKGREPTGRGMLDLCL